MHSTAKERGRHTLRRRGRTVRRRRIWVYVALFSTGFAAMAAFVPMSMTAAARTASAVPLGDYAGYADPGGVKQFGSDTSTSPTLATDYLANTGSWSDMVSSARGLGAWKGYRLVLAVPLVPASSGGSLAQGASGAYNQYFTQVAQALVGEGLSNAIVRLGWEFNGNWYAWSVASSTDAANFAAYWRQVVTAMRTVPGAQFSFLWNPNSGSATSYTPDEAYPGDAYVDYVGTDLYDECWCSPQTPQSAWSTDLSEQWGLNWLAGFAAEHGKAIAFPEWSVTIRNDGHGLGDDPYFVNQFAGWVAANNVAFTDIFAYDDTAGGQDNDITDGNFPNALAAFKQDFGGAAATLASGSPVPAPAPAPAPAAKPVPVAAKPAPVPAPKPAVTPVHGSSPSASLKNVSSAPHTSGAVSAPGALPSSSPAAGGTAGPAATAGSASGLTLAPRHGSRTTSTAPATDVRAAGTPSGGGVNVVAVVGMFMLGGVLGLGVALRGDARPGVGRSRRPAALAG